MRSTNSWRIERILGRPLFLAKADQPDFVVFEPVDVEPFLEDVFMRWSEVAPRSWGLGSLAAGTWQMEPGASSSGRRSSLSVGGPHEGCDDLEVPVADLGPPHSTGWRGGDRCPASTGRCVRATWPWSESRHGFGRSSER